MITDLKAPVSGSAITEKSAFNMSIQGLRGFAALLVAICHIYRMSVSTGLIPEAPHASVLGAVAKFGLFGVVLFFFISGYLIVQTLTKHGDVRKFLVNRAVRIYPVFLLLTIPMFVLGPLAHYEWMGKLRGHPLEYVKALVENVLFLPGMFNMPIAQKNAWSLSYEFAFYLIACAFYLAATRFQKGSLPQIMAVAGSLALACLAIGTHNAAGYFVVGVLVFFLEPLWNKGRLHIVEFIGKFSALLLIVGFAVFDAVPFVFPTLGALLFATIVAETGLVSRLLHLRFFQFLGKISYSLYLIHPFVYDPIRIILVKAHNHGIDGHTLFGLFYVIGLPLAVGAAWVSYTLIEDRFTRRVLKRAGSGKHTVR